jgi:hypothetical protein
MPVPTAVAAVAKARRVINRDEGRRTARRVAVTAGGGLALTVALPMTAIIIAVGGLRDPAAQPAASATALTDIPRDALAAYQQAAEAWGIDWAILAAIGKVECDHGRAQLAGCNPPDTINRAGARGYMQFIGSTWRTTLRQHELEPRGSPPAEDGSGYATDGDRDGDADPWSWPDATHSAARYLVANSVNTDLEAAVWHYNHDDRYVERVLEIAASYRASGAAEVALTTVEGITVNTEIAGDVAALLQAARAAGFELTGSGYRDTAQQIALRRAHCGTTHYSIYEMPPSECSPPTARPGESMHERGLAIDFSCGGVLITSRDGGCYRWMVANANSYGLFELASQQEPWHWSVNGG